MNKATSSLRSAVYALSDSLAFLKQKEKSLTRARARLRPSICIAAGVENDYNTNIVHFTLERLITMGAAKRKPATMRVKPKEEVNKKALVWAGTIVGVVIVAVAVLLIVFS
jgi:late competence protein required for DNA uptake (superfamily II DNA/RNA helicase)